MSGVSRDRDCCFSACPQQRTIIAWIPRNVCSVCYIVLLECRTNPPEAVTEGNLAAQKSQIWLYPDDVSENIPSLTRHE